MQLSHASQFVAPDNPSAIAMVNESQNASRPSRRPSNVIGLPSMPVPSTMCGRFRGRLASRMLRYRKLKTTANVAANTANCALIVRRKMPS